MSLHEYDPDLVQVIFAAVPLSGFAEDEFVSIEEDGKIFDFVKGVDGDISRSKIKGVTALLTVTLMQTSKSNAVLSAIVTQDLLSGGGAGVSPCMILDANGVSMFAAATSWVEQRPKAGYGAKAGPREWKIRVCDFQFFEGGT
jgi:hypothetical protein